jgi:hypothetical protein
MKSVTLVAFIGSWFRNSLTRSFRKSFELRLVRDEVLDEVVVVWELVGLTVMSETPALAAAMRGHSTTLRSKAFADQTRGAPNPGAQSVGGIS